MTIACPKCAEQIAGDVVICPHCDYVIDTSFLGDDILNESGVHKTGELAPVDASASEDAVMIGDLGEDAELLFSDASGSFLTADTMDVVRRIAPATVYVSKSVQELLKPEAVLRPAADIAKRQSALSPFELHVLSFLDASRPVARVQKKSGLSNDDVRIALAMLIEKNAIELVGTVKKPSMQDLFSDDGDTIEEASLPAVELAKQRKKSAEWKEPSVDVAPVPEQAPSTSPWQGEATTKRPQEKTTVFDDKLYSQPAPRVVDVELREQRERAKGFYDLAHAELQKGNRVRAHMYARLAAETDPQEPKYQELLRSWAQTARAVKSTEGALVNDADVAERQGNVHKAIALLQEAVQKNPKNAAVHNRLALLLATKLKQYNKASEHLMTAIELDPDNVAYKNNLGKIIALADERGAAIERKSLQAGEKSGLLGKLKKAFD